MEAAVVGGSGFIGQYAVRALREHKCTVSVLDSKTSEIDQANVLSTASHILWLAQPTRDLIKRLVHDTPELQKFVFSSSILLYGEGEAPQTEDAAVSPLTQYEKDKWAEEEELRRIFAQAQQKLVIARLANVYGDVKNRGIIGRAFSSLNDGTVLTVSGDGMQVRDYIHVEDVARMLAGLLMHEKTGGVYNIATGTGHTIREVLDMISRAAEKEVRVKRAPAVHEKHSVIGDSTKLAETMGLKSRIPLALGLDMAYKKYARASLASNDL